MSRPRLKRLSTGKVDTCKDCLKNFDTSELVLNKKLVRGYDKLRYSCKSKRNASRKLPVRDYVRTLKENTPCADCKHFYPFYVMDFDHLPGFEKSFGINKSSHYLLESVKAEIEKCEIVCANCHRVRTHQRL